MFEPTRSGSKFPLTKRRGCIRLRVFFAFVCWMLFNSTLFAQGGLNIVVQQTGGGNPLISSQEVLPYDGASGSELVFNVGFFTGELPTAGQFLDSFTFTLQDAVNATAVLGTIDANGILWAPLTPGGVTFHDADIVRMAISPPGDGPIFGQGIAYLVTVPVPSGMVGPNLTLTFDLFDNEDQVQSLGWYTKPELVPVPEPEAAPLFSLALLLGFLIRRKRIHAVQKPETSI